MKLIGQRWRYRVGNSLIHIDNAFSWTLWGQERMLVNGETVHRSGGRLKTRQTYIEPWLSPRGEGEFRVRLRAKALGIACEATLDDDPIDPEAHLAARWTGGTHDWPEDDQWQPVDQGAWIDRR